MVLLILSTEVHNCNIHLPSSNIGIRVVPVSGLG